ncbi:MAG: DUF3822 family protein [Bacteroidia bacterium]|nr:DUF3822 family protein [Bacteroidia bacterium]
MSGDRLFTAPEFQKRYDEVCISLFTPKFTLVPAQFFDAGSMRSVLAEVTALRDSDVVESVPVPQFGAVLIYSNSMDESLSKAVSRTVLTVSGESSPVLPEIFFILRDLQSCQDYNKILASYKDGCLHLAIAQGKSLLLANSYKAVDFTTAEYFIFLALRTLQLNPEVSTISWRTPLTAEEEMSLYRYFKAVETI